MNKYINWVGNHPVNVLLCWAGILWCGILVGISLSYLFGIFPIGRLPHIPDTLHFCHSTEIPVCVPPKAEVPDYKSHPLKAIQLNNPGNIRRCPTNNWKGESDNQESEKICTFDTPEHGIRAIGKLLINYQSRHGLNTIRKIIYRYAPPNENRTEEYVAFVAQELGISADQVINVKDYLLPFIVAIIEYESGAGNIYPESTLTHFLHELHTE